MGKSLEEYARENPMPEPPQEAERRQQAEKAMDKAKKDRERVDRAKEAITAGLAQGSAPQFLLYRAIDAIGILDHDEEWAEARKGELDAVYSDLAQESFLVDNAAIAAERLDRMQKDHNAKLRKELNRQLGKQIQIEKELRGALQALNELEDDAPPLLG